MRCWLLLLVGACRFEPTLVSPDDASSTPDMRVIDTPPDQFDDRCFAGGDFYFCLAGSPDSTSRTLVGAFDTGDCSEHGASVEVIAGVSTCLVDGDTLTIPGAFVVSGGRPLALAALQQITITNAGRLDIAGTNLPGPGSNLAGTCTIASGGGGDGGGGGGAGGSLGSRGGNGGDGNGSAGGLAQDPTSPVATLRGGCPGGLGGSGGGGIAAGGNGGGAVLLAARTRIAVDGVIDASGSGAVGGTTPKGGGGGGGSGGLVVFHTATLAVSATAHVVANGGGGGGGAGQGTSGQPGLDPDPLLHTTAAPGGSSTTGGNSNGGDGATLLDAAQGGEASNGGGGGGGGTGVIRVLAGGAIPATAASPTPTN